MEKVINIDFIPNFEDDDYQLIKKILGGYEDLAAKLRVERLLKNYFPLGDIYFFNSARSALNFFLLFYKKYSSKREIITQAFSCLVIPNAIKFASYKPIFVDIDNSFNLSLDDLKNKINNETAFIIIQNTFGLPAKIENIINLAKEKNILIIENLTHSFGAKYKGTYLGNFGDLALISFNRNKVISSIIGGALVINNQFLKKDFEKEYKTIPEFSSYEEKKLLLGTIIFYLLRNKTHNFLVKNFLKITRKLGITPEMINYSEKIGKKPKNYLAKFPISFYPLLENQLKKLERFNNHRKEIANIYLDCGLKSFEINQDSEPIFLRFPILVKNRDKIFSEFKKEKIYLGDWYKCVLAPCGSNLEIFDYQEGMCPKAEEATNFIINLPTHIKVSKEDAYKIAEKIKSNL
ncbi:MAG: hypothetical protein C4278_00645 [Patescibacteria group bacterium]